LIGLLEDSQLLGGEGVFNFRESVKEKGQGTVAFGKIKQ
jgi:hypothetical protein